MDMMQVCAMGSTKEPRPQLGYDAPTAHADAGMCDTVHLDGM